jgi:hypothetical protein
MARNQLEQSSKTVKRCPFRFFVVTLLLTDRHGRSAEVRPLLMNLTLTPQTTTEPQTVNYPIHAQPAIQRDTVRGLKHADVVAIILQYSA